jgi:hypothetical protein
MIKGNATAVLTFALLITGCESMLGRSSSTTARPRDGVHLLADAQMNVLKPHSDQTQVKIQIIVINDGNTVCQRLQTRIEWSEDIRALLQREQTGALEGQSPTTQGDRTVLYVVTDFDTRNISDDQMRTLLERETTYTIACDDPEGYRNVVIPQIVEQPLEVQIDE